MSSSLPDFLEALLSAMLISELYFFSGKLFCSFILSPEAMSKESWNEF